MIGLGGKGWHRPSGARERENVEGERVDRTWNILLVDDDPDFLYAAKRVLRQSRTLKANVETAQQVDEALRIVDQRLLDVVVADFRMQPDDGAQLLRKVHEARPDLKRVLLTGFDEAALKTQGVKASEVDLVLDKNDLLSDLDRKLTEFLEKNAKANGRRA